MGLSCEICEEKFASETALQRHIQREHVENGNNDYWDSWDYDEGC